MMRRKRGGGEGQSEEVQEEKEAGSKTSLAPLLPEDSAAAFPSSLGLVGEGPEGCIGPAPPPLPPPPLPPRRRSRAPPPPPTCWTCCTGRPAHFMTSSPHRRHEILNSSPFSLFLSGNLTFLLRGKKKRFRFFPCFTSRCSPAADVQSLGSPAAPA
ncbi:hypothetical protein F7725_006050, partial [Dissostichus mawsoni]